MMVQGRKCRTRKAYTSYLPFWIVLQTSEREGEGKKESKKPCFKKQEAMKNPGSLMLK